MDRRCDNYQVKDSDLGCCKIAMEFTNGMKGKLDRGYAIEAVVDQGNDASLKIARAVLGGEEGFAKCKNSNTKVHSFPGKEFSA